MKKVVLIISLVLFSLGSVFAQSYGDTNVSERPVRKFNHVLKFGPFHMLAKRFNVGYEIFLPTHKYSFYISPTIYISSNDTYYYSSYNANTDKTYGYILDMQFRIYLGDTDYKNPKAAFNHLYLAPYLNTAYYLIKGYEQIPQTGVVYDPSKDPQYTTQAYTNSLNVYGGGLVFGYQLFLFRNKVSLDAYFGGGVRFSTTANNSGLNSQTDLFGSSIYSINYTGIVPRIGFQIGYAF